MVFLCSTPLAIPLRPSAVQTLGLGIVHARAIREAKPLIFHPSMLRVNLLRHLVERQQCQLRRLECAKLFQGPAPTLLPAQQGLANPAPIIQTFYAEDRIFNDVKLDGVVTLVDAKHANFHLDDNKPKGVVNEVPEFEEAAFNAPLDKVVHCKTKYGWNLLQVLSEREESILQDINPEELHSKMQDPGFFEEAQLIDVREPEEVAQASLPGFKVLPLRQFGTWGSLITEEFDPQKDTYVLCHHGVRSLQVAQWLQTQGFKKVFNVAGGIHAYAVKADPSVPKY